MKTNFLKILTVTLLLFYSCNNENTLPKTIIVTTSDFTTTINEHPIQDQIIGTISGETNKGSVSFEIISQSPNNAVHINSSTGELKVLDNSLFIYEINLLSSD